MPEEIISEETVADEVIADQGQMQDDAWGDANIDHDSDDDFKPEGGDFEEQLVEDIEPEEKGNDLKPSEKPAGDTETVTPELITERPKGYLGMLYDKSEEGNYTIDNNKALKSLLGDAEKPYTYKGPIYEKAPDTVEPPVNRGEQMVEEHHAQRKNIDDNMNRWRNSFVKNFNENGGNANAALLIADNDTSSYLQAEYGKMDLQHQKDLANHWNGDNKSNSDNERITKDANHNMGLIAGELGGDDHYNEFFHKEGIEDIRKLFTLANPGSERGLTQKQYQEKLSGWWNSVRSNMNSFRVVQDFISGRNSIIGKNIDTFRSGVVRKTLATKGDKLKPSKNYTAPPKAAPSANSDAAAASRYFSPRYSV